MREFERTAILYGPSCTLPSIVPATISPPPTTEPQPNAAICADSQALPIVFLSGGTALTGTSAALMNRGVRVGHILSPFDSGGSSGFLRDAFGIPAIGDVRSRMLTICCHPARAAIVAVLGRRLAIDIDDAIARVTLRTICGELRNGSHAGLPAALALRIADDLDAISAAAPAAQLRFSGASIGNLAIVGGWIRNGRDNLGAVIDSYATSLEAVGALTLSSEANAHLAATLSDGRRIIGQHRFTAKSGAGVGASVDHLAIVDNLVDAQGVEVAATPRALSMIQHAAVVCLPVGSLWSSVLAQLLPNGMSDALCTSSALRVYVPNPGWDPEQGELSVEGCVQRLTDLIATLRPGTTPSACIDIVLLDSAGRYPCGADTARIKAMGITVIETRLGSPVSGVVERVDGGSLADALIELSLRQGRSLAATKPPA